MSSTGIPTDPGLLFLFNLFMTAIVWDIVDIKYIFLTIPLLSDSPVLFVKQMFRYDVQLGPLNSFPIVLKPSRFPEG